VQTATISPFVDNGDSVERAKIRAGMTKAMAGHDVPIVSKRENTLCFLDHCDRVDPETLRALFAKAARAETSAVNGGWHKVTRPRLRQPAAEATDHGWGRPGWLRLSSK